MLALLFRDSSHVCIKGMEAPEIGGWALGATCLWRLSLETLPCVLRASSWRSGGDPGSFPAPPFCYHSAMKWKLVVWPKDMLNACWEFKMPAYTSLPNLSACQQAAYVNKYTYQTISRRLFNVHNQAEILSSGAAHLNICQANANSTAPFHLSLMHKDLCCVK